MHRCLCRGEIDNLDREYKENRARPHSVSGLPSIRGEICHQLPLGAFAAIASPFASRSMAASIRFRAMAFSISKRRKVSASFP